MITVGFITVMVNFVIYTSELRNFVLIYDNFVQIIINAWF